MLKAEIFFDPSLLSERIDDIIVKSLERYIEDPSVINKMKPAIRADLMHAFNEHSKGAKILTSSEKDRLRRIQHRIIYLKRKMETRDPQKTSELKDKYGTKFVDFNESEVSALEWAVQFVKEHAA